MASAIVVLPEPDSPTRASTSPSLIVKLTSLTMGNSRPSILSALMQSPSTTTRGAISGSASRNIMACSGRQTVNHQVDADRQAGEGCRRYECRSVAIRKSREVLAHHRAPIGVRRLHAEAEETQATHEQEHKDEA